MSTTFNLTNTASDVNAALQAVVGADTTPDGASANMVTSQGVYNHIQTELGPFKGKTLTTENTGIAATDNDTSVPTSAAVKDFVDSSITSQSSTPNNLLRVKIMLPEPQGQGTTKYVCEIPFGYKATSFFAQAKPGQGHDTVITIFEGNVNDSTAFNPSPTNKGTGSTRSSITIDITDVTATDTNFLIVSALCGSTAQFRGGYFNIVAV